MIEVDITEPTRIQCGSILSKVAHIEKISIDGSGLEVALIDYPKILVISQDCDIQQHHSGPNTAGIFGNSIVSLLVAPIYNADHFFEGSHLHELGIKSSPKSRKRTEGKIICQNKNPRFHFLKFGDEIPIVDSIIDFKHYFSLSIQDAQRALSHGDKFRIKQPYITDICQRYATFLSRIALPNPEDI